jgi:SAM-dependent methyltransferase
MSSQPISEPAVSPDRILNQLQAYRGAAALNSAIELDLFTRIAHGTDTAGKIAAELSIPVHGVACLCDFLVREEYLFRQLDRYSLAEDAARFLDRTSAAYVGGSAAALHSPGLLASFERLTECVRKGGSRDGKAHPGWFGEAQSKALAKTIELPVKSPVKILDLAAGHGLAGIALAKRYPQAIVVAVDRPDALQLAQQNADHARLSTRFQNIPGDPCRVSPGRGYDAVVLAAELFHRDPPQIHSLLKKSKDALKAGGRLFLFDFLAGETEEFTSAFVDARLLVLATARRGVPYSITEMSAMLKACKFNRVDTRRVPGTLGTLITASPVA